MGAGGQAERLRAGGRRLPRGLLALVVVGAFLSPFAGRVPAAAPAEADPTTATVRILESGLDPALVEVEPGATVIWVNQADGPRSVVAADSSFDSGDLEPGNRFQFAFTEPGTVTYTVLNAPSLSGTVVVRAASAPAPAPAPGATPPVAAPTDFAYTGSGSALTGAAGVLALGLGAALLMSARRIGVMALSGLSYFLNPDDLLPSRRHRRALKAHARRARSGH